MKEKFINALENNNIDELRKIPKGDLHNHAPRGGNKRYIENNFGTTIPKCPKFKTLSEMNHWNLINIKPYFQGKEGYEQRIEAAFLQAKDDGIAEFHMSVSLREVDVFEGSVQNLIQSYKTIHKRIAPEIIFTPEIAWNTFDPYDESNELLDKFLSYDYFKSFDMYGDEFKIPNFKKIFRKVKDHGLILKAHVGEFGTAELVRKAVEELELDQVQHGIAVANSSSIMKWLSDNKIQLNVCPTSNVLLSRVESYKVHPIKKLYDNGVKVTINSDDMIIFDQSVSDDFLNLYNAGLLNASELNDIRENSLSIDI